MKSGRPRLDRKVQRNGAGLKCFEWSEEMQAHLYIGSISLEELFAVVRRKKGLNPQVVSTQ